MEVILFQPEIPQNAGNIARTCSLTNTKLILIRPLGFALTSRHMKRSGLDYWEDLDFEIQDDLTSHLSDNFYFFSTKGKRKYTEAVYPKNAKLIFGSETKGLPSEIYEKYEKDLFTIPMRADGRSLNLSNAVAIVLYEALRQRNFLFG